MLSIFASVPSQHRINKLEKHNQEQRWGETAAAATLKN